MDLQNAKNAHFWQVDNELKQITKDNNVLVLPSKEAWKKFLWTRKLFSTKPKEGYFIWVKHQPENPLTTCVTLASHGVSQNLNNLMIIEKGIKVKANVVCQATKNNLHGFHNAKGKLILKENASLDYDHIHSWGDKDFVNPEYQFILEKGSKLSYSYKNLLPPKHLKVKTDILAKENASANIDLTINAKDSKVDLDESLSLQGHNSQGVIKLRVVAREKSDIQAESSVIASAESKGHLDCQGLLVDKSAVMSLTPKLVCKNPKSQITHEASIGKISEEELNYLRMRGLKEEEAVDLIISGFLKS